ncbi:MAG: 2-succinyl-5-enolpyruvyl-6-hydroxy-3-cyclohexene-1-carboxylic-acid synthase [Gemmatimonadota bacterium]
MSRLANELWGRTVALALARSGVRLACVSPGSRSTPLVLALAGVPDLRLVSCLDERSAAYFALGAGRVGGGPAVVVTTSGTAVANLFPAVVEAAQSEAPLLLLTADRPARLRDADANQTIGQAGIFGAYARFAIDVGEPSEDPAALRVLAAKVARAVAAARGRPAGPAHLNVPFAKPLEPERQAAVTAVAAPFEAARVPRHHVGVAGPPAAAVEDVARTLAAAQRPLLVCGAVPDSASVGAQALALARETGTPVLADPLSGARFGPGATEVTAGAADRFLSDPAVRRALAPDVVLRVGSTPTSVSVQALLEEAGEAPQIVVDGGGRWKDHQALAASYVRADEAGTLRALREAGERSRSPERAAWTDLWRRAEGAAQEALRDATTAVASADTATLFEGAVAREVAAAAPAGATLFVSSSMPVRDLDAFAAPRDAALRVLGNRGASGIDGVVSSALGVSAGAPAAGPVIALIGDLALLHDANGLALAGAAPRCVFVVVNNDGGGIFQFLSIREFEPEFTEHFATPHGRDLSLLASFHGLDHSEAPNLGALPERLAAAVAAERSALLEIRTERESNRTAREAVTRRIVDAVTSAMPTT